MQVGPRTARRTRTFSELRDAVAWCDTQRARRAWMRGGRAPTVRQAGEEWLEAAAAGRAITRTGQLYRPSTLGGYERELRGRVFAAIGDLRLDDVTRGRVLGLIGALQAEGLSASTVRNVLVPLRALFRYANDHEWTTANPTRGVAMPGASSGRRERFASAEEAPELLAELDERDRPLWATALYAGLRRGELMELRWSDVELEHGRLHVRRAWDPKAKVVVDTKTTGSRRTMPLPDVLAGYLAAHKARHEGAEDELVFARGSLAGRCRPGRELDAFADQAVGQRATAAWRAVGLEPLTLHEARHSFASMLLEARVDLKLLSELMGHSSIRTTADLYAHLAADAKTQAAAALDALLARAEGASTADAGKVVVLHPGGHSQRESA